MPFEFINNATLDATARKRIRSQAAKGKNVGRILLSRRKQSKLSTKATAPFRNLDVTEDEETSGSDEAIALTERIPCDGMSVFSFPAELNPRSRDLAYKSMAMLNYISYQNVVADCHIVLHRFSGPLFPPELSDSIEFVGVVSMWVRFIFTDEACKAIPGALNLCLFPTDRIDQIFTALSRCHLPWSVPCL